VVVGSLIGVLQTDEGKGGNAEGYATVQMNGAHRLPVGTTTALTVGAPVYITSGNVLTPVSTSNTLFGYALEPKGTSPQTIIVELAQV
jgi:predicted RecA/RadA family phage recombinase